jgi:hypothetical protein
MKERATVDIEGFPLLAAQMVPGEYLPLSWRQVALRAEPHVRKKLFGAPAIGTQTLTAAGAVELRHVRSQEMAAQ